MIPIFTIISKKEIKDGSQCLELAAGLFGCVAPRMNLSVPINTDIALEGDKALVYFIRPNTLGFGIHAAVYDDDNFIGFVPYNQKLPYMAEPGEHLFMVVSEAADFMKADLLPGKTYYVRVVPRMGAWRARFSLAPVTKDQLKTDKVRKQIEKATLIKNNDSAYKWASDNHDSVLKKKAVYFKKWQSKDEDQRPVLKANDGE
ncbi:MAG TPA: hypothetical protein ENH52_08435 [Nitrospirae bacterium]|nr:hypothetical protein [Nitrospirota bacterium]